MKEEKEREMNKEIEREKKNQHLSKKLKLIANNEF